MSFAEIERIVRHTLPASARRHRPWWSNNPSNSVITKAWLDAGFKTEKVDMASERLVFRRIEEADPIAPTPVLALAPELMNVMAEFPELPKVRHPLFGALKGLIRIPSDVDITKPADPDWGRGGEN